MTSTVFPSARRRSVGSASLAALLLVASACGSGSDETASADPVEAGGDTASAPVQDEPTPNARAETGPGSGTVTMVDGTVYEFEMRSCDTSENAQGTFLIEDGFDLSGTTADAAFKIQIIRAGFDEESITATAGLEGDFDSEGKNSRMLYTNGADPVALTVDGGNVSGQLSLRAIGPTRPHGDTTTATVEVRC